MPRRTSARRPARMLPAALAVTCAALMFVDHQGGDASPFDAVRDAVGDAVAPAQEGAAVVARPLRDVPAFFESNRSLRADVARLEAENASLRGQVATTSDVRLRAAELDGLLTASRSTGLAVVPARVVGIGPAQAFTRTVTIDAGTQAGIRPDLTVLNSQGLVGRVVATTKRSATVLLVTDRASVVGARLGSNAEIGFLRGRGDIDGKARLDLDLVDNTETPGKDDVVVTWGSTRGAPYVPGIPIGTVGAVFSSPREQAKHAVIDPFVDFSSLDLVGVVVEDDTESDRAVIRAGEVAETADDEGGR